jgi:hypothetical protein
VPTIYIQSKIKTKYDDLIVGGGISRDMQ